MGDRFSRWSSHFQGLQGEDLAGLSKESAQNVAGIVAGEALFNKIQKLKRSEEKQEAWTGEVLWHSVAMIMAVLISECRQFYRYDAAMNHPSHQSFFNVPVVGFASLHKIYGIHWLVVSLLIVCTSSWSTR